MLKHIFFAPPGWEEESPNPFTSDGCYGDEWSCFLIRDAEDENIINGRRGKCLYRVPADSETDEIDSDHGPYFFRVGRRVPDQERRLADFLRYEVSMKRKVIVSCPPDIDASAMVNQALQLPVTANVPREDDPPILLHSTTAPRWVRIREEGRLISLAQLRESGIDFPAIGYFAFGEPLDYSEYVMFGGVEWIASEHVVSSQEKGYLITEEDVEYEPGARLYFDAHKIIRNGLAVRDGLHTIKVHGELPLDPYLIAAITPEDVDPESRIPAWKPRMFLDAANDFFRRKY